MPAKKRITRPMILDAALSLLRERGMEAVTVKGLAARLGCSTQPIYLSFGGMEELRTALTQKVIEIFLQELEEDGDPTLCGMGYVRFALREKALFRFLFLRPNSFAEVREALKPMMEQAMTGLMVQYHITHEQADYLHDQLWMEAHGIASMVATEFCRWDLQKAQGMLEACRDALTAPYGRDSHEI